VRPRLETIFPNLASDDYAIESPVSSRYNCIAWAAGDDERWWEPPRRYYWPPKIPREYTVATYRRVYARQGYRPCANDNTEEGYGKIAIFVNEAGVPTHVARQKEDGSWTSKLGKGPLIRHATLHGIEGDAYGTVGVIMRRRKKARLGV
jgi:hypothetical protein